MNYWQKEGRARHLLYAGRLTAARRAFERCRDQAAGEDRRERVWYCEIQLATIQLLGGETERSRRRLQEALLAAPTFYCKSLSAFQLACLYRQRRELDRAREYANRALHFSAQVPEPGRAARLRTIIFNHQGNCALDVAHYEDALGAFSRALEAFRAWPGALGAETNRTLASLYDNIGYTLICLGSPGPAVELLELALEHAAACEHGGLVMEARKDLALAYLELQEHDRAAEQARRGLQAVAGTPVADREAWMSEPAERLLMILGQVACVRGEEDQARQILARLTGDHPAGQATEPFMFFSQAGVKHGLYQWK